MGGKNNTRDQTWLFIVNVECIQISALNFLCKWAFRLSEHSSSQLTFDVTRLHEKDTCEWWWVVAAVLSQGRALSTELQALKNTGPKETTMSVGWAALSYFLVPSVVQGRGWGLTHWTNTTTELHSNSSEKVFTNLKFIFLRFISVNMCECVWEGVHEELAQRPGECWSLGTFVGDLACYGGAIIQTPARTRKSHLSRTEILLWCPKYNHIYKVISTYLATFTKKGLLSYLSYIYFVNLWRKGKMFFTHSVTYPLQARHYVSSQRT